MPSVMAVRFPQAKMQTKISITYRNGCARNSVVIAQSALHLNYLFSAVQQPLEDITLIMHCIGLTTRFLEDSIRSAKTTNEYTYYKAKIIRLASSTVRMNLSPPIIFVSQLSSGAVSMTTG